MKRYKCLTRNSSLASAIFVPYYAGLDFRRNIRRRNVAERDAAGNELFKWLKKQPQWKGTHASQRPSRSRNDLVRTQVILQCKSSFKNCRFLDCVVKANSCDDPISLMKLFRELCFLLTTAG
ncbi:unnamed protein product [Brassica napus]|uniref:(rape) hypothetical protein n=1 Tax=Brassica napus TaxID=3708 RepID=A0A816JX53_BRANA|nr:unnamed protein product [Brassica napus]